MKFKVLKLKKGLVYAVVLTTLVMYIPAVYNSLLYGILRYALFGLMGILVCMAFSSDFILSHSLTRKTLIALATVFLEYLVSMAFKLRFRLEQDVLPFAIVLLMIMVGGRVRFREDEFLRLCTVYCCGTIVLGFAAILTYLGGFSLAVNANDITGKNQIGAIVAVGGGIAFYLSQLWLSRRRTLFYLALAAAILVILVVVRCRTALVGYLLFAGIIAFQRWPRKIRRRAVAAAFIVYVLFFNTINGLVVDSLLKSTDLEDDDLALNGELIDQLSTNRHERNVQAVQFLAKQPIEGALVKYSGIKLIHNYVLLRLVRYGIIMGFPYVWIYLVYLTFCIRRVARKCYSLYDMGPYLLIIPLFCSLLEPSAPFGPGTVEMMPYLICGFAYQKYIMTEDIIDENESD